MFDEMLITASKLVSLAIFLPIYVGVLVYACWGGNQASMDAFARIPLNDDGE